jgi:cysteine desulfurase NifS
MMEYRKWEKGGLRTDGKPGFETPTGKFEIASTVLEEYGYDALPIYVEPREGPIANPKLAQEFPLVFNSGARPHTDFRSQHHGIRGLVKDNPEPAMEMNADDAAARGIADGDLVEVRSPRGAVRFRARVTHDIVKGAIECNMGGGTPVGPKAWQDNNVNELTDVLNYDDVSGFPVYKALLCEVSLVEAGPGRDDANGDGECRVPEPARVSRRVRPEPAERIYLDNNATTQVDDAVREAMLPFLGREAGNPSSIHGSGREARDAMEAARRNVARLLGTRPRRIVFTGSGSESDNLALKGVALARAEEGQHLITSTIEHPAVLAACRFLEKTGFRVTHLPVDGDGLVSPDDLRDAMTDGTTLVSIMMANNEVGTIQPVAELCRVAHEGGALFHTDAVQAAGKIPIDAEALDVDLLSLSGHKFHGPKGIGVLYVKPGVVLEPLVHGGQQERGLRAGTENVPAIVGIGKAAERAIAALREADRIRAVRDRLEAGVRELLPGAIRNGHATERLPNTLNLTLPDLRGESLVIALDQKGMSLSSGSACKSGNPAPTHVLLAMGRSTEQAHCSVRFSLSASNTEADADRTVAALREVLAEIESTVRFLPCK